MFDDWSIWQRERTGESQDDSGRRILGQQTQYWIEHPNEFYGAIEAYQAVLLARSFDVGSKLAHPPRKLMTRIQKDAIDAIRSHNPQFAEMEENFRSAEENGDGKLARSTQTEISQFLEDGISLLTKADSKLPLFALPS